MMYDSDDALERALFALPLEEPPADLRGAILASTAYRPAAPFSVWEVAGLGAVAAITLWLVVLIAMGGGGALRSHPCDHRVDHRERALQRDHAGVAGNRGDDGLLALDFHRIAIFRARGSKVRAQGRPITLVDGEVRTAATPTL